MKKVVVVDDDPDMRGLIVTMLGEDFTVWTAADGAAGLDLVRRERPDLVVLDLLMPRMHGFEVCKRIREDKELRDTKVLISSSKSYAHDVKTATTLGGADGYLVKPFDAVTLRRSIEQLIGGARVPLQIKFWGTRGSIPSPGPRTQKYGGNTPCVELRAGNQLIIVDAGTGLRELGVSLMTEFKDKPLDAHLLIGHTHWDHIQGLPFFTPAYLPQNRIQIYGVHGTTQGFADVLSGQMHPTYFPVAMKDMASKLSIIELADELRVGPVKITTHYLNHPGITVGFRIETADWAVCYLSDHEPYGKLNNQGEFSAKEDAGIASFVSGADVLISEAQYTDEEYRYKRSWGHSTFTDVLGLAHVAQAKRLALFHHDPLHSDDMMDRFAEECREHVSRHELKLDVFPAQEGMAVTL